MGLARSTLYYQSNGISSYNLMLMNLIDEQYLETPFYGSRRMAACLKRQGYDVNRKRIQRLMQLMGLQAIFPGPNLSKACHEHKIYPYLLRGLHISRANQIWSADITYIRLSSGFIYLVAIMDWFSRMILSCEVSISLESEFCVNALERAMYKYGKPEIFNTDQGVQFTCREFTEKLEKNKIRISMDGKGRALDNIFIERLWRSLKYEEVYLKDYESVGEAVASLRKYFDFYNQDRPHQSLEYMVPAEVYRSSIEDHVDERKRA
jgi:putative transposase